MAKAVALARHIAVHPADWLRPALVLACAVALILAERALPLI
jgi:hypothetical protein